MSVIVALIAAAGPSLVILVGHLGELITESLPIFQPDGPGNSCSEKFQLVGYTSVRGQACRYIHCMNQRFTIIISEYLGETVEQRKLKRRFISAVKQMLIKLLGLM